MLCGTRKEERTGAPAVKRFESVLDCIGRTPIVRLNYPFTCPVYAKLEMLGVGGSMKDRVALHMIEVAEKAGLLKRGGTIIEASSGNQGAALAMIGAAKGYRVIITASEKISEEKLRTLRAFGAEVRLCPVVPALEDPRGYYMAAKQLSEAIPGAYWPNQYHNPLNPEAHYLTTAPEIWEQTKGRLTYFFAAAGSSGTICGVGRFLKEKGRDIKVIAVDAATSVFSASRLGTTPAPYKTEGLGIDYLPAFLDRSVIDDFLVATDDEALSNAQRLAREQGILSGISSGAVLHALFQYQERFTPDDFVIALFADSGKQYLSKW
jgi:cystathionine beta-synthase